MSRQSTLLVLVLVLLLEVTTGQCPTLPRAASEAKPAPAAPPLPTSLQPAGSCPHSL